ncbi:carbohydrate kinase family protein [Candidatus Uhrbacteria bacterium]|nr:carbohydrate kinase family protein [Candidatus Uhrbacteria bacterium]
MYDIVTIGSATRDVFLMSAALHPHRAKDAATHIEACFPFGAKINIDEIYFDTGGGATNNAATFRRLGNFRTAAICRLGDDASGRDVFDVLKADRVDTQFVQVAHGELTAYASILSPGGEVGERTILVYRGASRTIEHARIPWSKLRARWFHGSSLGGDLSLLKKLLSHAKKIKAGVAFNPGGQELKQPTRVKPLFKQLAFLILNREEAVSLTGAPFHNIKALLRALLSFTPYAIMTDGPKGAYAVESKSQIANRKSTRLAIGAVRRAFYVPSVGHPPKNITGAGDAFGSGFITGWIKGRGDLIEALRVGSFNADNVVQYVGAKNGILEQYPSLKQLRTLPVKKIPL